MNFLKLIRRCVATVFILSVTALFLDFTGALHSALGFAAKVQFIPALLSFNFIIVAVLFILTLLLGRVYCSAICPLGIFQDLVQGLRKKKNYYYSHSLKVVRYGVLCLFVISLILGISSVVVMLEPYSIYGRFAANIFAPIYLGVNNILAYLSQRVDSYMFYNQEIWVRSITVLGITIAMFVLIIILAWRNGRTYCNVICPVGTFLGLISKFSLFKHVIEPSKCGGCKLCEKRCKAACINSQNHEIDYTRCVTCFNCIDSCKKGAIQYKYVGFGKAPKGAEKDINIVDNSRRTMLTTSALVLASTALKGQEAKMDGGLAIIEDKKIPNRDAKIVPPGAKGVTNFNSKCTACQLCVSVCPNQVLRPSNELSSFMQPYLSYERGYCRPECNKCSQVCPAGAINEISIEDKSSTQVGHAVWIEKNCVVLSDKVNCGNCARHCPTGAIQMIDKEYDGEVRQIPAINIERCIGCGACENLCPSRPFSAIYVEGHSVHKLI